MITNSTDDSAIQIINDVMLMEGSQDNLLTTVDNITLQSDMTYTIQVSFSILDGEFNITTSVNFSKCYIINSLVVTFIILSVATYDTQSVDITNTSGGRICVICTFSANTIALGCGIELLRNSIMVLPTVRFTRSLTLNIAEGCIPNIITGYYDLYVYDVENDNTLSQLPAIIKNQVFVDEQTTTSTSASTTTSTLTTTTTSSSTTTVITSITSLLSSPGINL